MSSDENNGKTLSQISVEFKGCSYPFHVLALADLDERMRVIKRNLEVTALSCHTCDRVFKIFEPHSMKPGASKRFG